MSIRVSKSEKVADCFLKRGGKFKYEKDGLGRCSSQ
jgi:hypothetical protein